MDHENESFDDLPKGLIQALNEAENSTPLITARVDRQLADLSREQFKNRLQPSRTYRPVWAALAASVVVAVVVAQFLSIQTPQQTAMYADVDGSGQIDIADVLLLARTRDPEQITQAEIDAFAHRIVSLSSGGDAS